MRGQLIVAFLTALLLAGCATRGLMIEDVNAPMADLQRLAMRSLPIGQRTQSVNGREYFSKYFIVRKGEFEEAEGERVRYHAHILILGDRRPYKIQVIVPMESKDRSGQYSLVKYDDGIASVISRRIQKALHERREDRNIVDDFRVF